MPKITEAGKIREERGKGTGADYKPWIKSREVPSRGTATTFADYKHGREIQTLSQGEVYYYYLLRWRDDVEDIREQYPLDLELTNSLCDLHGIKHPRDRNTHMTTDFLVTKTNGSYEAYSIKTDKSELNNPRTVEKLYIEKLYWESLNIPFYIKYKADANKILVFNIRDVVSFYNIKKVQNKYDLLKHKIAHKEIIVDMESNYLKYNSLLYLLESGEIHE